MQNELDAIAVITRDILYFQISNRESIIFANNLVDQLKVPSVIHFMDDWPSVLVSPGLFKNY